MALKRFKAILTTRRLIKSPTRLYVIATIAVVTFLLWASALPAKEAIDPRTGSLSMAETDLVADAGAVQLEVTRWLVQEDNEGGLLGTRWQMNWETRLERKNNTVFIRENGAIIQFDLEKGKDLYKSLSGERIVFDQSSQATRTRLDGSKDMFDAHGRLMKRDLRNNNEIFLNHDEKGRLTRVDGPKGSFLELTSDQAGRISLIKASTGATIAYSYSEDNLLSKVQADSGESLSYLYDIMGALIQVDYPQTGTINFAYDFNGRVVSRQWADSSEERYEYDDKKNLIRHINASGGITTTVWSSDYLKAKITDPLGNVSALEYDEAGRLTKVTGSTGAVAEITYDNLGRTKATKDPEGQTTRFEYVGQSALVKSVTRPDCTQQVFEYDAKCNLERVKTGTTTTAAFTYYPDGLMESMRGLGIPEASFSYDAHGRLQSEINALGETTQYRYDAKGNLTEEVNTLGGKTIWEFDAHNRLVSQTNPVGRTTRYTYDDKGRLAQLVDPEGGVTRYDYDSMGRAMAETDAAGRTTRYDYDPAGRLAGITNSGNQTEHLGYDKAGNLVEWTDQMGQITTYQYDPLSRLIGERYPSGLEIKYRYNTLGQLEGIEDSAGSKNVYQRNLCGRLTSGKDSVGAVTRYEYDPIGNILAAIDPLNQTKHFSYTKSGQVLSVSESTGDEAKYAYDPVGRLVEIRRPSGALVKFKYDAMGNMIARIDPLKNQHRYTYDIAGHLKSTTDPSGKVIQFNYNGNDRLVEERLPDGKRISHKYDVMGYLVEADDGAFPIQYSYDSQGQVTKKAYPAIQKSVSYVYDAQGLQRALINPNGRKVQYEYDNLKQLKAVVLPDLTRITFDYDFKDRISAIRYPNDVSCTREYDSEGRITKMRYKSESGQIISGWTYQYDAAGNLVKQTDHQGHTTQFEYDPAGQLTLENGPDYGIRYRYLPGGNRAEAEVDGAVTTYRYDVADRLIQHGSETLAYDKNGRLVERKTSDGRTQYKYDTKDHLIAIVGPTGKKTTYGYAPTGERIWKKDEDGTTYYLYDGLDLISEMKKTGESNVSYIHAPGIDRPLAMIREGRTYYYHADRLGSIRHLTDDRGAVVARYDYDAFGNLRNQETSVPNPFTFTAREFDSRTGLYYYRARYYDSRLGRFLTIDPIDAAFDEPLQQNPYLYAQNNPIRFTDPLGLEGWEPPPGMLKIGPAEHWWQMYKAIEQRPYWQRQEQLGNPAIRNLRMRFEEYLKRTGQLVEARPATGSGTQQLGGSIASRSGTMQVEGAVTPRSNTVNLNAGAPIGSGTKGPWYKRTTGQRIGTIAGATIGAVIEVMNYNACVEEGGSPTWCALKSGAGIVVGAGIGAGVAAVAAAATAAGGAVAGGAVVVTAGTVGLYSAGKGTIAAAQRWGAAPLTKQQSMQQAGKLGPTQQAIDRTLNSIDVQIEALRKLGEEYKSLEAKAGGAAKAAERQAGQVSNNLNMVPKLQAEVNNLMTDCNAVQDTMKTARDDFSQAAIWAERAKQGFEGAEAKLSNCLGLKDVDDADSLFNAAIAVAKSAKNKYEKAKSDRDAATKTLSELKERSEALGKRINDFEERYLVSVELVRDRVKETKEWTQKAENKFRQFYAKKEALMASLKSPALASLSPQITDTFREKFTQVRNIPPFGVRTKTYSQQAKDAEAMIPGEQLSLSGAIQSLSQGVSFVSYGTLKAALTTVSNCQQPGDPQAELGEAAQADSEIGSDWAEKHANARSTCMAKLEKRSENLANLYKKKKEDEDDNPVDDPLYKKSQAQLGEKQKERLARRSQSEGIDTYGFYKVSSREKLNKKLSELIEEAESHKKESPTTHEAGEGTSKAEASSGGSSPSSPSTLSEPQPPAAELAPSSPDPDWHVLEEVVVSGTGKASYSTNVLKENTDCKFEISGTISLWPDKTHGVDAAYCYDKDKCGGSYMKWSRILIFDGGSWQFNNSFNDLNRNSEYNENHAYTFQKRGQGHKLKLYLRPDFHVDVTNGSMTVKIFEKTTK